MKEFIVKTKMAEVKFNFPTNLNELSKDYLKEITDNVVIAPNYSLIGIVYHEALSNIILTCKNRKKNASIGIIPIFIKSGKGEQSIVDNAKVGQKLLIDGSRIEFAHKCAVPGNKLTINYLAEVLDNSVDTDLYQKELTTNSRSEVLFIEFKIIPNCDIIALYEEGNYVECPYVEVSKLDK